MKTKQERPNVSIPLANRADEKELRIMHAELRDQSGNLPELDLHGFTREDALSEIQHFISHQIFIRESCCRIIHGKGKGILEHLVKQEITKFIKDGMIETSFSSRHYPNVAIVIAFPN